MIPIDQTKFGRLEGNCTTACVASILECSIDDIPPGYIGDGSGWNEGDNWMEQLTKALRPMKLGIAGMQLQDGAGVAIPSGVYVILGGMSERGVQHSCVGANVNGRLEVIHDPHPSRAGLISIEWVDFLVRV